MKTKKIHKKMKLNKSTISNLETNGMGELKGGTGPTDYTKTCPHTANPFTCAPGYFTFPCTNMPFCTTVCTAQECI